MTAVDSRPAPSIAQADDPELLGHLARVCEPHDRELIVDLLPGRTIRSAMRARLGGEIVRLAWSGRAIGTHVLTCSMRGLAWGHFQVPRDLPGGTAVMVGDRRIGMLAKPLGAGEQRLTVTLDGEPPPAGDEVALAVEPVRDGQGRPLADAWSEQLRVSQVEAVPLGTLVALGTPADAPGAAVRGLDPGGPPTRHPVGTPLLAAPEHPRFIAAPGIHGELFGSGPLAAEDRAGGVLIVTGEAPTAGLLGEVRFRTPLPIDYVVSLWPLADDQGRALGVIYGQPTPWGFALYATAAPAPGVYSVRYRVEEPAAQPLSKLAIAELVASGGQAVAGRVALDEFRR